MEKKHTVSDENLEEVTGAGPQPSFGSCPTMPKGSGPDPDQNRSLENRLGDDDSISDMDAG